MTATRRQFFLIAAVVAALPARSGLAAERSHDEQERLDGYVQRVAFLVRQNFHPLLVRLPNPEALVALRFDADGKFLEVLIEERSGDPGFDVALESALRQSVPVLPPPPLPADRSGPFVVRIRFR